MCSACQRQSPPAICDLPHLVMDVALYGAVEMLACANVVEIATCLADSYLLGRIDVYRIAKSSGPTFSALVYK